MVFGNNTPSDISKLSKIPRAAKRRVVLGNFEILGAGNRSREIFGKAQETFTFTVEKTNFVTIFLRQWKK